MVSSQFTASLPNSHVHVDREFVVQVLARPTHLLVSLGALPPSGVLRMGVPMKQCCRCCKKSAARTTSQQPCHVPKTSVSRPEA